MGDGLQNKIHNIQALRFIAATAVMMVHFPLIKFGSWGVDIFFIISGFIMMYVTEKNNNYFFLKRIIRIVPIYWILTFGVFLISVLAPEFLNNTSANYVHLLKSLFFIPFNKNEIGHYPILFLGWTLNYEIIFYLLFALTLVFFKNIKFIGCSILIILFIACNSFLAKKNFIFETYSNTIILEFIFGLLAYKLWNKFKNYFNSISIFNKICLFLFSIILSFLFFNSNLPRFLSYGVPSFFLVLFFLFYLKNISFPKIFIMLGDASYCLYLIHPYVIQFFYKVLKIENFSFYAEIICCFFIAIFIFVISIIVYKYVEKPINSKLKKTFIKNEI